MKKVMCKNNSLTGAHALQLGETYNVLGETDTHYNIRSVRGHHDWYKKENFERVMTYIGDSFKSFTKGKNYNITGGDDESYIVINNQGLKVSQWRCFFIDPVDHTVEGSKVMKYIGTDVEYMTKGKNYNVKDDDEGFYIVRCDNGNEIREPHDCFIDPSDRDDSKVMMCINARGLRSFTEGKNYNVKESDEFNECYMTIDDDDMLSHINKAFFAEPSTVTGEDYKALDVLRTPSCLMVDEALAKSKMAEKHPHYYANVKNLEFIDVYDVIELFGVKNACLQHVLKKIMVIGNRGHKNHDTDLQDIYDTLDRYKIMRGELHNEEG